MFFFLNWVGRTGFVVWIHCFSFVFCGGREQSSECRFPYYCVHRFFVIWLFGWWTLNFDFWILNLDGWAMWGLFIRVGFFSGIYLAWVYRLCFSLCSRAFPYVVYRFFCNLVLCIVCLKFGGCFSNLDGRCEVCLFGFACKPGFSFLWYAYLACWRECTTFLCGRSPGIFLHLIWF